MTHRLSSIFFLLCALSALSARNVKSQDADVTHETMDSLSVLQFILDDRRADRARMERILDALDVVDSVYKTGYPTWSIVDADMKERIFRSFRMRGKEISRADDVVVVANPQDGEILEIAVGNESMGRVETHTQLSDSLYREILGGDYARGVVEDADEESPLGKIYGERPELASVYASLFGTGILFNNMWGVEGVLGHEEIGYHFWSTGSARVMAVFNRLKLGIIFPFEYGGTLTGDLEPLDIRPRLLSGTKGFSASYEIPAGVGTIGSNLTVGDLTKVSNYDLLTDSSGSYFVHTIGQAFYRHPFLFENGSRSLTLKGGIGYHQIAFGQVEPDRSITTVSKENFISPILSLEYQNRLPHMYGVTLQVYSSILYIKGWVELIENFIFLDLQYYTPLIRERKPWEQGYFFMVSPRIQIVY